MAARSAYILRTSPFLGRFICLTCLLRQDYLSDLVFEATRLHFDVRLPWLARDAWANLVASFPSVHIWQAHNLLGDVALGLLEEELSDSEADERDEVGRAG